MLLLTKCIEQEDVRPNSAVTVALELSFSAPIDPIDHSRIKGRIAKKPDLVAQPAAKSVQVLGSHFES
jgi:hypothetical protein